MNIEHSEKTGKDCRIEIGVVKSLMDVLGCNYSCTDICRFVGTAGPGDDIVAAVFEFET